MDKPKNLKFRESKTGGRVIVFDGEKELFRSSEYKTSAEWAMNRFGLTQPEMYALYYDYKEDYDKR